MSAQTITDINYTGDVAGEVQDEVGATTPAYIFGNILGIKELSSLPTGTISIEGAQDDGSGTLSVEGEYGTFYFFLSPPKFPILVAGLMSLVERKQRHLTAMKIPLRVSRSLTPSPMRRQVLRPIIKAMSPLLWRGLMIRSILPKTAIASV